MGLPVVLPYQSINSLGVFCSLVAIFRLYQSMSIYIISSLKIAAHVKLTLLIVLIFSYKISRVERERETKMVLSPRVYLIYGNELSVLFAKIGSHSLSVCLFLSSLSLIFLLGVCLLVYV